MRKYLLLLAFVVAFVGAAVTPNVTTAQDMGEEPDGPYTFGPKHYVGLMSLEESESTMVQVADVFQAGAAAPVQHIERSTIENETRTDRVLWIAEDGMSLVRAKSFETASSTLEEAGEKDTVSEEWEGMTVLLHETADGVDTLIGDYGFSEEGLAKFNDTDAMRPWLMEQEFYVGVPIEIPGELVAETFGSSLEGEVTASGIMVLEEIGKIDDYEDAAEIDFEISLTSKTDVMTLTMAIEVHMIIDMKLGLKLETAMDLEGEFEQDLGRGLTLKGTITQTGGSTSTHSKMSADELAKFIEENPFDVDELGTDDDDDDDSDDSEGGGR